MKDFTTGSPARSDDFFFRDAYIDDVWDSIRKEHVLVLAPRRTGKTSVMLHLADNPRQNRTVVFRNIEELSSPAEFCQTLILAIHEQHPDLFRDVIAKSWGFIGAILNKLKDIEIYKFKVALRESDPDWEENWKDKADELIANLRRTEAPFLIILDELPDMILNIRKKCPERLETFLHWFRKVRQDPEQDNIRWLVGGSVNLVQTLNTDDQLKLINDFREEPLPPFTDEELREFVTTMFESRGVTFDDSVLIRMRELLGKPIPFFLQMLTQELFRDWRRHQKQLTAANVDEVFERVLMGETTRAKLQHFRTRIKTHYSDEQKEAAFKLLKQIAVSDDSVPHKILFDSFQQVEATRTEPRKEYELEDAFNDMLVLLLNDFYIEDVGDRSYDFASHTLKLWWRKYYG